MEAALKGSVLRSYVARLRSERLFAPVLERGDERIREALELPVTSSQWVPLRTTDGIIGHIEALRGTDYAREFAYYANQIGIVEIIKPLIRAAMRIGGASPHSILSHLDSIMKQQSRGMEFGYEPKGERHGIITIVANRLEQTRSGLVGWEGGLINTFDIVGAKGGAIRCADTNFDGVRTTSHLIATWQS